MNSAISKIDLSSLIPYSAINKMVEVFDINGLNHVDIGDPKVWYQTIKESQHFTVFLH